MSKGRTIKRNPIQIDPDNYELNEQYFNFASFDGINSNKNYVGVNQYSFEDANNVYVDQNSQLHTRPPIKSMTISVLEPNEYPVDIVKVNNVTFYKTYNGSEYRYRFKYHDEWRVLPSTQKSLITFINDYFVIFLEDDIILVGWNYDDNNIRIYQSTEGNNIVYVPITKIVQGNTTLENEAKNLLTTKEITRYLFEYGDSIPANAIDLVGQTVVVNINGKEYSVELQQGTPIIFAEPISELNLDSVGYNGIQSSENGIILIWNDDYVYLSEDGQLFSVYSYPEALSEQLVKDVTISKDGTEIIVTSYELSKVYDNLEDENSKFKYVTHVYYMYTPFYSSDNAWKSFEIVLLEGYDDLLTMVSENVGPRYNTMFKSPQVTGTNKGYSSVYNTIDYLFGCHSCCVSTDEIVIIYDGRISGGHYSYTSDAYNFHFEQGYHTASVSVIFLVRIYRDSNGGLVYKTKFGTAQRSQYNDTDNSIYYMRPLMYVQNLKHSAGDLRAFTPVLYTETNSFKIVAFQTYTEEYIAYKVDNSEFNMSFLYESHDILYSVIDSNDNILNGFGVVFPTKLNANDIANNWFAAVDYLYVLPTIFNTLYKLKYTENYSPNIPGTVLVPDLVDVDESMSLHTYGSPAFMRYTDGILEYNHVGNEYSNNQDFKNTSILNLSAQLDYIYSYGSYNYSDQINWMNDETYMENHYKRMTYPITIINSSNGSKNQADSTRNVVSTIVSETISVLSGSDILTSDFYYYQAIIYPLLNYNSNRLFPIYITREQLENGSYYGKILYYNDSDSKIYSNQFTGTVSIDIPSSGDTSYVVPDFSEDFITTTIILNNLLYQSLNRTFEGTEIGESGSTVHPELYFPIDSEVKFIDKITNLIVFSQTSLGVFLENLVYEYQYDTSNDVYTLTPTKLQLGCKEEADILIGYDGSTIYMTQLKGLAGLNYQDFVQSTEQVYTYFTDAIMDLYDKFKGDGKIKLYQYKDWIFMYKQDNTELYIFDTRSSTWWKWTNPYPIQKIVFDGDNLLLLINNQIAIYDFETTNFTDFIDNNISWKFRSQKLHFSAPNNYKHIRQLNVITTQSGHELRYKLKFINYRNLNNLADVDTVDFEIDQLTTLIKRVTFIKTNAFQFEISNDETDPKPKYFETPDIAIKYRITERVR